MSSPGYVQRGRIIRPGPVSDTYMVEVPGLAPGFAWGPVQSTVHGLVAGDRVLLTQVGMTRGDMVIVGRLPAHVPVALPIAISDVTGLSAALADRATDAELAAVIADVDAVEAVNATQTTRLDGIDTLNTTQNSRLTAIETLNTTQDGRLTAIETLNTTQTSRLDGIDTLNTTQNSRLTAIETLNTTQDGRLTRLEAFYATGTVDTAYTEASKVIASVSIPTQGSGVNYKLKVHVFGWMFMSPGRAVDLYLRNNSGSARVSKIAYFINNLGSNGDSTASAVGVSGSSFSGALTLDLYAQFINPATGNGFVPATSDYLGALVEIVSV